MKINNYGEKKTAHVYHIGYIITPEQIEPEITGCSGFEKVTSKPDQPGLSSSIRLEAMME